MAIFSWALGLAGIAIAATFILRLKLDLIALFTGRSPKTPPNLLRLYGIGILVGFALFGVSMMLSMPR